VPAWCIHVGTVGGLEDGELFGMELLVGGEEGLPRVGAEAGVGGGYVVDGEGWVDVAGESCPG